MRTDEESGAEAVRISVFAMVLSLPSNDFLFCVGSLADPFIRFRSTILSRDCDTLAKVESSFVCVGRAVGSLCSMLCNSSTFAFTLELKLQSFATGWISSF